MPDFLKMGLILMAVGAVATTILATTEAVTRGPIAEAKRLEILRALQQVLPEGYDNAPDADTVMLSDPSLNRGGAPVTFYRARTGGSNLGAAYVVTAPDGYSGNIDIMMAVQPGGTISGIQIVAHAETPGLGDRPAKDQSWRDFFRGKTLGNVNWAVQKDGGDFDQFAGATITPRAIVKAVHRGLEFFRGHEAAIFAPAPAQSAQSGETGS